MLPEEWPIRAPDRESFALASFAGRDRLASARQDLFLPPEHRLTEQARALMTAMLHRLVEDVSAEIRALMPQDWLPANEDLGGLIDRLWQSRLLDIEGLIALLLRRADEERISSAITARRGNRSGSMIQPLVSGEDAEIAAAAMALLVARGRRRDRFGQSVVELDDIPAQDAPNFVHAVAGALCERRPVHVPMGDAERQLCDTAQAVLSRHDPSRSLESVTANLARLLDERNRLDDAWMRLAIDTAELPLLGHALARRAKVDAIAAIGELHSREPRRIMLLLRLADLPRELAGHLVAVFGDLLGLGGDTHALTLFDGFNSTRLAVSASWLALDPNFKSAVKALGHGHSSL